MKELVESLELQENVTEGNVLDNIVKALENQQEDKDIILLDYKEISAILGINNNKASDFLKKFGVKIGHWQIEKGSLINVLRENQGKKLI